MSWSHSNAPMAADTTIAAESSICILVASADLGRCNFMRVVLAIIGIQRVEHVVTSDHVVAMARRVAPDLVLLDDAPPVMDGLALIKQLRGHAATTRLPVITLTAEASDESRQRNIAALANVLLLQPCSVQDLRAAIHYCVPRYDARASQVPS